MAVVKCKPTSPGRRHVVKVVNPELHKGKPFAPLLEKNSKSGGRNNNGRITTRHIGGGHKQAYRIVDFKRNKDGIPAKLLLPTAARLHCVFFVPVKNWASRLSLCTPARIAI